jgi:ribose transport system ATP-binding protein
LLSSAPSSAPGSTHHQAAGRNRPADAGAVLEVRGLTKRFIGTLALDHVDFALAPGEIHALIGENGAGKSTLIKTLAGLYPPDGGEIRLDGRVVHPHSERLLISFVHQDLGLVDELSVGENVALVAGYPRAAGLINWSEVWRRASEIYHAMGVVPPDPRSRVGTLNAASKAVLGIVRALSREAKVIVLDEPTASLPEPDALHLFEVMRKLRAQGTSAIYVSHRLNELFGLVDRITVLRDGRHVRTAPISEVTPASLVEDMLGRAVDLTHVVHAERSRGAPVLEVTDLQIRTLGPISFGVEAGEIVGLVGLRGAGQETIGRAIFGESRADAGRIRLDGTELSGEDDIPERVAAGIALLAGDRVRESAFSGMSLRENLFPDPALTHTSNWRPLSPAAERQRTQAVLTKFDVRPANSEAMIDWLSGGNQQKVFVARWLGSGARVYILEEPTAGVDIGAKLAIHRMVRDTADAGAAVLVVSSDFEEVAALCDRALIIARGQIIGELRGTALTVDNLVARSSLGAAATAA